MLSKAGMLIAIAPSLGPVLGSYIAAFYDWHTVFIIIAVAAILMLTGVIVFIPKELPYHKQKSANYLKNYCLLFSNHAFLRYTLIQILTILWLWADISIMSFLLIEKYQIPQSNYVFYVLFNVSVYILGTICNQFCLNKYKVSPLICLGLLLNCLSAVLLIANQLCDQLTPLKIILFKIFASLGLGFILGNITEKILETVNGNLIGYATALTNFLQMNFGGIGVMLISYFYNASIMPLALIIIICNIISLICLVN